MARCPRLVAAALILLPLGGCALNAVRVESAKDFASASSAAMVQTRAYLNSVAARQREANAALVASDPSCIPRASIRIRRPNNGNQSLCIKPGEQATDANSFAYSLRPLSVAQLKPRLLLIAAIADYSTAMAKVAEAKSPDIEDELNGIAEKIDELKAFGDFLTGTDLPAVSDLLKDKRAAAIIGVVQFLSELSHEADQVGKIRELVAKKGDTVDTALASLAEQIDVWKGTDQNSADTQMLALLDQYVEARERWDPDRRVSAVLAIMNARGTSDDRADAAKAVKASVTELQEAHAELRKLLVPNPKLTPEQQAQMRKIARERIWRALNLIVGAASAFAGG